MPQATIKRGRASLVGGLAVGVCVLALWLGVIHEVGAFTPATAGLGAVVAACVAAWIRVADL